jgi:hypothetical protein
MITIDEIKEGDKVHYTAPYGKKTNGIVKTIDEDRVFVVKSLPKSKLTLTNTLQTPS